MGRAIPVTTTLQPARSIAAAGPARPRGSRRDRFHHRAGRGGRVGDHRGSSFSLDPAHPGRIAPGARPPHTLCPTLATTADAVVALGCQGGRSQPWILAQVAGEVLDTSDLAGLLTRPRWIIDAPAAAVVFEPGTTEAEEITDGATRLGLKVAVTAGPHDGAGHVQVARLRGTTLDAGSDPCADGLAAVL